MCAFVCMFVFARTCLRVCGARARADVGVNECARERSMKRIKRRGFLYTRINSTPLSGKRICDNE